MHAKMPGLGLLLLVSSAEYPMAVAEQRNPLHTSKPKNVSGPASSTLFMVVTFYFSFTFFLT